MACQYLGENYDSSSIIFDGAVLGGKFVSGFYIVGGALGMVSNLAGMFVVGRKILKEDNEKGIEDKVE